MQLPELKRQLKQSNVEPFYLFTGPEIAIMDIYINKIAYTGSMQVKRADTLVAIYSKLQNNTIMAKPCCYVIRDDKEYASNEKLWHDIIQGKAQGKNVLIFVYTNLDKRSKFFKHHEQFITEFAQLSNEVVAKYVEKEIGLNHENALTLAEMCDCNYNKVLLEEDKLMHLSHALGRDINSTFEVALDDKLIYTPPKDVIFKFIASACKRNSHQSYAYLQELQDLNESPLAMISLLYSNMRSMLLVQSIGPNDNVTQRTGLTAWQAKCAREYGKHYSEKELVRALRIIRETEKDLKTGRIDQQMAVGYILANIL